MAEVEAGARGITRTFVLYHPGIADASSNRTEWDGFGATPTLDEPCQACKDVQAFTK